MKKYFLLFLLPSVFSAGYGQSASTGLAFLKIGTGARSAAMGEAYSAVRPDVSSLFYNPAMAGFISAPEVMLMHKSGFADVSTEFIGTIIPAGSFSFGASLISNNVNDIQIRERPGDAQGTFGVHDFSLQANGAWRIDSTISVGAAVKYLYEKILIDEANGTAFDFGIGYLYSPQFSFAVSMCNVGSMSALRTEPIELPATLRLGGAYSDRISESITFTTSVDGVKTLADNGLHVHAGLEGNYDSLFSLRAGYMSGYAAKNITAGFGVCYSLFRFDYAVQPFSEALGVTHAFSLSARL